jgi:hypothetical protein
MSGLYGESHRKLQDRFDTRRLADRLHERIVHDRLTRKERAFIERQAALRHGPVRGPS